MSRKKTSVTALVQTMKRDTIVTSSSTIGIKLHAYIASFFKDDERRDDDEWCEEYIGAKRSFHRWYRENDVKTWIPLAIEKRTEYKNVPGIVDALFREKKTGKRVLIEWKYVETKRNFYKNVDSFIAQLNLYRLILSMTGFQRNVERMVIVGFTPDEYFEYEVPIRAKLAMDLIAKANRR